MTSKMMPMIDNSNVMMINMNGVRMMLMINTDVITRLIKAKDFIMVLRSKIFLFS